MGGEGLAAYPLNKLELNPPDEDGGFSRWSRASDGWRGYAFFPLSSWGREGRGRIHRLGEARGCCSEGSWSTGPHLCFWSRILWRSASAEAALGLPMLLTANGGPPCSAASSLTGRSWISVWGSTLASLQVVSSSEMLLAP